MFLIFTCLFSFNNIGFAEEQLSESIPLCVALEMIAPGQQIPIITSGIFNPFFGIAEDNPKEYGNGVLFSLQEPHCKTVVHPATCVEFASGLKMPLDLQKLDKSKRYSIEAVFKGILFGPIVSKMSKDVTLPALARIASISRPYCDCWSYRTKLLVTEIILFEVLEKRLPSPGFIDLWENAPYPIDFKLPKYPWGAQNMYLEGAVLLKLTIFKGKITAVKAMFGDPVLVDGAVSNVKSWTFNKAVCQELKVKYIYELEKRPFGSNRNLKIILELPELVRVIAPMKEF